MIPLKIYDHSMNCAEKTFRLINSPELRHEFGISDQLKRASISVPANIAEGYLRTKKVFYNHLSIAIGSTNEVITLLELTERLYSISTEEIAQDYQLLCQRIIALRNRIVCS
jgi:four helix bundle protein